MTVSDASTAQDTESRENAGLPGEVSGEPPRPRSFYDVPGWFYGTWGEPEEVQTELRRALA